MVVSEAKGSLGLESGNDRVEVGEGRVLCTSVFTEQQEFKEGTVVPTRTEVMKQQDGRCSFEEMCELFYETVMGHGIMKHREVSAMLYIEHLTALQAQEQPQPRHAVPD